MYKRKELKCSNTDNLTVKEIVMKQTGMDESSLLDDKRRYNIAGMGKAADLLADTIKRGARVNFYTDYDADGMMSALILSIICRALGAKPAQCRITVPRRFTDGYGIKEQNVRDMEGELLVTADNGIAAAGAFALAKRKGMKTIILDHHMPLPDENGNPVIPDADIVIDPHVTEADFSDYCGAGLCYRLLLEILRRKPEGITDQTMYRMACEASCYAAIATVGDSVSLTGENRRIVKKGLSLMEKRYCSKGLALLLDKLWMKGSISATDLSFKLVPCINAWGRLDDDGARIVTSILGNPYPAEKNVDLMLEKNNKRKTLTEQAVARIGKQDGASAVLVYDPQCPLGIAGIAAGRLAEEYGVPAIVLTESGKPGLAKGSGRSPEGLDLKAMLDMCPVRPTEYGGHPAACGLSVETERIDDFFQAFQMTASTFPKPERDESICYDVAAKPQLDELMWLYGEIKKYGPYGVGCPEPVVCVKDIRLKRNENDLFNVTPMANLMGRDLQHVKLCTECGMEVLMFSGAKDFHEMGEPMDVNAVGNLSWEIFKGEGRLSMTSVYVEPA